MQVHQEDLDQVCESIEACQNELEGNLAELDESVDRQIRTFNESNVSAYSHTSIYTYRYISMDRYSYDGAYLYLRFIRRTYLTSIHIHTC